MSNLFTVVVATLSIVSICLGAFGLLVAWGIDLDPVIIKKCQHALIISPFQISMATTMFVIAETID